jgi:hypothetical protein
LSPRQRAVPPAVLHRISDHPREQVAWEAGGMSILFQKIIENNRLYQFFAVNQNAA